MSRREFKTFGVQCDFCQLEKKIVADKLDESLKSLGWKNISGKDQCPRCKEKQKEERHELSPNAVSSLSILSRVPTLKAQMPDMCERLFKQLKTPLEIEIGNVLVGDIKEEDASASAVSVANALRR
jgi:hypothetical protein